jgi:DNA-binding NarL/FixJ family response regulator
MLCKCIQAVHKGQVWANSNHLQILLGALTQAPPARLVNAHGLNLLAEREGQVVNLVVDGLTNRDIAAQLGLSEHTISNYLFRIYNKLGVSSRVELVLYVMKHREQSRIAS